MNTYIFKCFDYSHDTHKWGIEYALDPDGENLVDVEWFKTEQERDDAAASARLVAAAPDLLAAVHGLLASCGPQHESETAQMYQERMTLLQWHIDRASEALTKATGEA